MRLILTEYISSLKEDGELDVLLQDILRTYKFEIITRPEKGRQYGVDIYAVGKDFEDNDRKKVFLITVKKGDLNRHTWNADQNSVQQSLDEIRTVFVRNNLAPQHKNLPVKIVVAFNGMLQQSLQQNWKGYADDYPEFEFTLWEIDFFINNFQERLLNEHAFSNETRSLIRKTIIHLDNPDYNLSDYNLLLDTLIVQFQKATSKRQKLKLLKELHLIVAIIVKYSAESNNLKHGIKCTEKYVLKLWPLLNLPETDKNYIGSFIEAFHILSTTLLDYFRKLGYIGTIKDGYSRSAGDSLTYTFTLYEQIGIMASCGLVLLQLHEIFTAASTIESDVVQSLKDRALEVAENIIQTANNNSIFYSPRADEHHIEINLVFMLLFKVGNKSAVLTMLYLFNQQMGEGLLFSNLFPEFTNSKRLIAELDADYEKRAAQEHKASNLFTVLAEWTAVCGSKELYNSYRIFQEKLLQKTELLLWFPEKNTEELLYTRYATNESGYALSGIILPPDFDTFTQQILDEFENNCYEKEFSFIKQGIWCIGLIASRHYKTYIFPYYWRQFLVRN